MDLVIPGFQKNARGLGDTSYDGQMNASVREPRCLPFLFRFSVV
jgi:hypothetical protein